MCCAFQKLDTTYELLKFEKSTKQLLEKVKLVSRHTQTFGRDTALGSRVDQPVVVLERVYSLQHGADPTHAAVYVSVGEEVRGEVAVETRLHRGRSVDPQRRVEQHVVQQLPCQERLTERLVSTAYLLSDDR